MKRIKRRSDRPMLKTEDPGETLRRLMQERDPVYAEADVIVHSRDVPHEIIIAEIISAVAPAAGRDQRNVSRSAHVMTAPLRSRRAGDGERAARRACL